MSAVLDSIKYDSLLNNVTKLNNILSKIDAIGTQVTGLQKTRDIRLDADIRRLIEGETRMVIATSENRAKAHKLQELNERLERAASQYRAAVYSFLESLAHAQEGDASAIDRVNHTDIEWLATGAQKNLADLQQVWDDIQSADGN